MLAEFLEEPFPRGPVAALLIEGDGVELRAHDDFFRAPLPRRGLEPFHQQPPELLAAEGLAHRDAPDVEGLAVRVAVDPSGGGGRPSR